MEKKIKIGLDLHGVIDAKPDLFRALAQALIDQGHEVHIITGSKIADELAKIEELDMPYTHLFSITDHHVKAGTPIAWDEKGDPHLDTYLWDKTKAEYCAEQGIDLHIDDSDTYSYFFKTPYSRFFSKDTHRTKKLHLDTNKANAAKKR